MVSAAANAAVSTIIAPRAESFEDSFIISSWNAFELKMETGIGLKPRRPEIHLLQTNR
jgi:hypothetical protein